MASSVLAGDEVLTTAIMDGLFIMVMQSTSGGHTGCVTVTSPAGTIAVSKTLLKKMKG
ncbi:hypothetical protein ACFLVK_00735 [Chloroflexota bacterium]